MSIRQYIGARYVVKIYINSTDPLSAEWESNTSYEPLTMVTYNNSSYISRKDVPANVGNPPANPSYWVVSGLYNGQIAQLQSDVAALQNNVDKLFSDTEINLSARKFLFIGDSYAAAHSNTWVEYACSYLGIVDFENIAVSGTGFCGSGDLNGFKDQIVNYTGNKNAITDIVVGGGLNDSKFNLPGTARTNLITNMQDFINYAHNNYPNAKIWLCYMGNAFDNAAVLGGRTIDKRRWCKTTYETDGAKLGFKIIPFGDDFLGASDMYLGPDGVHPSNYGSQVLGICVGNGLVNLPSAPSRGYYPINLSAIGNNTIYLNPNLHYDSGNGYMELSSNSTMQINIGTDNPTISSNTWYDLFTLDGIYFNHQKVLPLHGILSSTDIGGYCSVPILLKFEGNKCSFKYYETDEHGVHVSHTIPSYGGLLVERFDTMFPTWYVN